MELDKVERDTAGEMAALSAHVYGDKDVTATRVQELPEGWKVRAESSPDVEKKTGFFGRLYERTTDPKDGETRFAFIFRGTTPQLPTIIDDVKIALGHLPRGQFEAALDFMRETKRQVCEQEGLKPAEFKFDTGGHSLGGALAREAGRVMEADKVWAFNAPGESKKVKSYSRFLSKGAQEPEVMDIGSSYDIINAFKTSGIGEKAVKINLKTDGSSLHHSLEGLRKAMEEDRLNNKPVMTRQPDSIKKALNLISKDVSQSRFMQAVFNGVLGHGSEKKQPKAGPNPAR
ncbi:MAG: hypothetical protein V1721_05480 [Pseudomonadota bacterium]